MPSVSEWKSHFARRLKGLHGHMTTSKDAGPYPGVTQSLVGYLAEVCPPGSLERVESLVRGTVRIVDDRARPVLSREIPTDPVAVRETVERANQWLRSVRAGQTAGENVRLLTPRDTTAMLQSGFLVAGGLILLAPHAAVEGLQLAVRPRPLQSAKVKDMNFVLQTAMHRAEALAPLFPTE